MGLKSYVTGATAGLAFAFAASSISAATITFSEAPPVQGNSLSVTAGLGSELLTVTATGYLYTPNSTIGSALVLGAQKDVVINNQGLGVCDNLTPVGATSTVSCGSTLIDAPELALLTFSRLVNILSITFNNNDQNDDVDIFGGTPVSLLLRDTTSLAGGPSGDTISVAGLLNGVLSFGVGIFDTGNKGKNSDQVRISSITYELVPVSPVPLPAAGWLMIAGLGGLAALRRRKRA